MGTGGGVGEGNRGRGRGWEWGIEGCGGIEGGKRRS